MFIESDRKHSRLEIGDLYQRYSRWLISVVRRRGGGDFSEDIVQETYLRVSKMPADATINHPRAFLLRIAQNLMRNAARDAGRAAEVVNAQPDLHVVQPAQFHLVAVQQAVDALPEVFRDVFVMNRFGGMTYPEIARAMGLSVKTIEWRMSKALALLAATLSD